eukprot:scaffold322578_cov33-Prasinocladus_malaysianus.AAC.1
MRGRNTHDQNHPCNYNSCFPACHYTIRWKVLMRHTSILELLNRFTVSKFSNASTALPVVRSSILLSSFRDSVDRWVREAVHAMYAAK